jgi:hypothetical protein
MKKIVTFAEKDIRCARCAAYPTLQSATELRPGVQYLTLRCPCCLIVYDAQAPFAPAPGLSDSPSLAPALQPN